VAHKLEFRLSENPWTPTAVIEEVNARTGSGLKGFPPERIEADVARAETTLG
jgi:hypothetical protein